MPRLRITETKLYFPAYVPASNNRCEEFWFGNFVGDDQLEDEE
jgi:hypothetical protein